MALDDVSLRPYDGPTSPTQSTNGAITFSDPDVNDTHTVGSVVAEGSGCCGPQQPVANERIRTRRFARHP